MTTRAWTIAEVETVLGPPVGGVSPERSEYARVRTDSRAIEPGDLFVALRGERFDGHDFLSEAVAAGAGGVVVARRPAAPLPVSVPLYLVDDTLLALGRLANHRRRSLAARVVGITGSVGKTTTKDLTQGALTESLRTHATAGNFNNRVGLPLTVFAAPPDTEALILEMGTNEPGEIAELTRIAEPDVGVLTTVSEAHLEKLGSLAGVLNEKMDLVRGLAEDGLALVGDDPPTLAEAARATGRRVRVAGVTEAADPDLRAERLAASADGRFSFLWRGRTVELAIPGRTTVTAAALALGVAAALGVETGAAIEGVARVAPGAMRGEVRHLGSLVLLVDCYNASPQSVRAAGELLEELHQPGGRVAVLGTMLELGTSSKRLHTETLAGLRGLTVDRFYLTGEFAAVARDLQDPRFRVVPDVEDLANALSAELIGDEAVLLKASRGVRLERVIPRLEERFGAAAGEGVG